MHRGHDRLKPVLLLDKVSNRGDHVVDVGVGQPRVDAEPERVTTAAEGVLGIIPDSMAAPRFLVRGLLREPGVEFLSAGIDEVPHAYKDIHDVMAAQVNLVESLGRFDPRIMKITPEGEKPGD